MSIAHLRPTLMTKARLIAALFLVLTAIVVSFLLITSCGQVPPTPTPATPIYSPHCVNACPVGQTGRVVERSIYTLQNNPTTKLAAWVAYTVDPKNFGPKRSRTWKADPLLPENVTLEPDDYTGAHTALSTDRGHQAPLATFAGAQWRDTNFLSNITPQKSDLNQGPWRHLESAVRDLSRKAGPLHVITGPLFSDTLDWQLPNADEEHLIPTAYFKVILRHTDQGLSSSTFVMPQTAGRGDDYCDYLTPLSEAESLSSLSLIPGHHPQQSLSKALGCS